MLKEWQFNVLFVVGVGGIVLLFIGPSVGLKLGESGPAVGGIGAILTYILTQRDIFTKHKKNGDRKDLPPDEKRGGGG